MVKIVLSHFQAEQLLRARDEGRSSALTTLDLGLSAYEAPLDSRGVELPGGQVIAWASVAAIAEAETKCFAVEGGEARPIEAYSEWSSRVYSLMPTAGAPTLLISGIPMHRIKGTDPHRDTLAKVRTLAPIVGRVLDTATGLGYTAIEAARTSAEVVTIELDPAVLDVARQNPWSRRLFEDRRITQLVGDSYELVREMGEGSFQRIVHDPPMFSLAGELYSGEFYRQLHRVLARGGRLFHYIGDPESRSGRGITRSVARRLTEAGFSRVVRRPEAFGLVAYK